MSNFEYIISSLPYLTADFKYADGQGFGQVMQEIKENLGEKDCAVLDFLLKGFQDSELGPDFYAQALGHPNKFIRAYFSFDLNLRNAKVRFLNLQLGRPEEEDVLTGKGGADDENLDIDLYRFRPLEFEEEAKVQSALSQTDLLSREKELDDIGWAKIDSLETFHYFDLTAVLAYVAKLHIVNRWLALDEEKGRELFRKLVDEVRGTFKGIDYKEK